jgi:hypothetical protein
MELDVRAAVAATVAYGSARVERTFATDSPLHSGLRAEPGTADFARRRAHLEPVYGTEHLWDGPVQYTRGFDEESWRRDKSTSFSWASPLWPLDERLDWQGDMRRVGTRRRRGATLDRFRGTAVVRRPAGDRKPSRLTVELCTDGKGRIRLASATLEYHDLSQLAPKLRRGFELVFGSREHPRWTTIEYWAFGTKANIDVPSEDEVGPSFRLRDLEGFPRFLWELWKRRGAIRD